MSQERLDYLKNQIERADDSPAGLAATENAIQEINDWITQLYKFIEINPETKPAKACGKTIVELWNFMAEY